MRAIDLFKEPYRECEAYARQANANLHARIERQRILMFNRVITEMQFNLLSADISRRTNRISQLIEQIHVAKLSDSNLYIRSLRKNNNHLKRKVVTHSALFINRVKSELKQLLQ